MSTIIIDASVAAKLLFQETDSDAAEAAFLTPQAHFLAPEFIRLELANIVWKRLQRAEIDAAAAQAIFDLIPTVPVELLMQEDLLTIGFEIAAKTGCTVYDGLYLAAAVLHNAVVVTADKRLVQQASSTPFAQQVRLLTATP